ncbi:MAG: SDR family NAD(P)-dependent oxidoreductase [Planctomycetota bacterium]|jgi:NAD(P)-dependent dehydrogenase (short-subunit alcohol dehydrogenase family)|nr:SDR family NAD(P)-dependent oxidoreductase [Planctomycetota bacterium]MDP6989659.1 SDR family NAD(P)-dependent oxidoreductase [Planctomycetota bacterium]
MKEDATLHAEPEAGAGRRALVIGASSGIGRALVRRLAAEGYGVAALARRKEELASLREECAERGTGEVLVFSHDVQELDEVGGLFERVVRELGGLDLCVFAAGIMPQVAEDEYDTAKDAAMIAVNLTGCVAWLNPVARLFASQRGGTLVGISSVAGDRGRTKAPVYGATKAAMNTYLESLRNRLADHGVHVCTIKPGFVDTAMLGGADDLPWVVSADTAARRILRAARWRVNVRYVPMRWWWVMAVIRAVPSWLFSRFRI